MTFDHVLSWALKAKPGEKLIYHKGKQLTNIQNKHDYSDAVWGARYCYNAGLIELVQKRDGGQFFYTAIKRKAISPPEPAYSIDGDRIDRFAIPHRFYRNSACANEIPEGKWDGITRRAAA